MDHAGKPRFPPGHVGRSRYALPVSPTYAEIVPAPKALLHDHLDGGLRPGTIVGISGKLGAFVETKNASIGAYSKVPHLTYVGDATIGEYSNIGASSVFVNYDGVNKHHTTIGSHVRTGSDTMFIAPVTVGDGAYSAAGTVLRRNVPPGALAVSGGAQRNIEGWVQRKRPGTASAQAAAEAIEAADTASQATEQKDGNRE